MSNYQHQKDKESMLAKIKANEKMIDDINDKLENTSVFSKDFDSLTLRRRSLRIENQSLKVRIENLGKPKCGLLETVRLKEIQTSNI